MIPALKGRQEEELKKEPLDKGEEEEFTSWLKLNIKKTKIMASGPITSCQIGGEQVETVTNFLFLGSTITADGDCKPWNQRMIVS